MAVEGWALITYWQISYMSLDRLLRGERDSFHGHCLQCGNIKAGLLELAYASLRVKMFARGRNNSVSSRIGHVGPHVHVQDVNSQLCFSFGTHVLRVSIAASGQARCACNNVHLRFGFSSYSTALCPLVTGGASTIRQLEL